MVEQGSGGDIMAIMTEEDHEEELIKHIMKVDNCSREDAINIYVPGFKIIMEERRIAEDAIQYQYARQPEYPTIEDVVVALAEKEEGDSTMWDEITAKRTAVKAKYSKP